jgi:periplasmic protein TonB
VPAELRQSSVAGIVLDAGAWRANAPRPALGRAPADGSVAAVVLGTSSARGGLLTASSFALAVALHAGAGFAGLHSHSEDDDSVRRIAAKPALQIDHVLDLDPPELPPPPPPPATSLPVTPARAIERASSPEPLSPGPPTEAPPPPAEAGQVVLAEESANEPLDFTGFAVSTGKGSRYIGGTTAASGTGSRAVHAPVVDRRADSVVRAGTSRARPVGRPSRDWDCPWPAEAGALSIDEQFVVIRAVVRADGTVVSAELISDPGYGFGRVALACARRQRFPAATDDDGRPIVATSPPIRVRFTRSGT